MSEPDLTTPDELQVQDLLDHDGTRYVDSYAPIYSGDSWGALCPQPLANMLGLPNADRVETWVELSGPYIIHRVVVDGSEDEPRAIAAAGNEAVSTDG